MTALITIGCIIAYCFVGAVVLQLGIHVSEDFEDEVDLAGQSFAWHGFLTLMWPIIAAFMLCVGLVSAVGWLSRQIGRISFNRSRGRKIR